MIEFLCPEGHKIRCPAEKAGRPAKCPRCGVGFRIPTIEELGLGQAAVADNVLSDAEVTDVPAAPRSSGTSGTQPFGSKERQIEFLCPNGHHLHGPASLQGRAGECPECGSRFRIPIIDEPDAKPESLAGSDASSEPKVSAQDEITLEKTPSAESDRAQTADAPDFLQVMEGSGLGPGKPLSTSGGPQAGSLRYGPQGASADVTPGALGKVLEGHPLAALFIDLWAARGEGSRVEVHLESGSVLVPDGYLKSQSQHDYAVLVTRDPDGCWTMTVVPWSSISRIILRAVKQVPGEVVR